MNVLSLFDGTSCGRAALGRAGVPVKNYYASEIDKHVIQIAQKNFPDMVQLGNVGNNDRGDRRGFATMNKELGAAVSTLTNKYMGGNTMMYQFSGGRRTVTGSRF